MGGWVKQLVNAKALCSYHLDQGCVELEMDPTILKVYEKLEPDIACNYHHYLPELLDKGLRILVYAGDRDLVCNWVGSLAWMEALRWGGRGGFSRAQPVEYSLLNGTAIGSLKSYSLPITGGQLSFVKVYGAGHSVAMDVPRQALKMLTDFLDNKFP
ncbi:conserved hypothetical protein [Perkinsus marinus ATCC 50983]|uniref:Serine carboxypeptidase n=1 Tax=Perkinsus marinus (strain ATCC 50983 / TXsc) TaxID=423536 RepID=C5L4J5_PERM5|nr:conserved hypothetical protein [Perkinsus marinus ATCC 50983]EER08326.1 conserved hypothetical protein [Perkinsus marinus ATCC 50983]|eukprot:XP_002776510.1 conserved hypothetical protein [Perkinsus marinus ATCC 50983]